jgi:hypothetical protein
MPLTSAGRAVQPADPSPELPAPRPLMLNTESLTRIPCGASEPEARPNGFGVQLRAPRVHSHMARSAIA